LPVLLGDLDGVPRQRPALRPAFEEGDHLARYPRFAVSAGRGRRSSRAHGVVGGQGQVGVDNHIIVPDAEAGGSVPLAEGDQAHRAPPLDDLK
jgi:hypothetical protein